MVVSTWGRKEYLNLDLKNHSKGTSVVTYQRQYKLWQAGIVGRRVSWLPFVVLSKYVAPACRNLDCGYYEWP